MRVLDDLCVLRAHQHFEASEIFFSKEFRLICDSGILAYHIK